MQKRSFLWRFYTNGRRYFGQHDSQKWHRKKKTLAEDLKLQTTQKLRETAPKKTYDNHFLKQIRELKSSGDYEGCYNSWRKMRRLGFEPDLRLYNLILSVTAKHKNHEMCKVFLEEMQKDTIHPDISSYSSIIETCKEIDQGHYYYNVMRQQNIKLDAMFFTSFLKLTSTDLGESLDVFKLLRKSSIEPNVISINMMLNIARSHSNSEIISKVYGYFEEFRINPDAATFNILLSTCITLEEVDRVWSDMLHSGVKPNQISYTTKVDRLTQLGYPRYALQCFRELEKSGMEIDTLASNAKLRACRLLDDGGALQPEDYDAEEFDESSDIEVNSERKDESELVPGS